MSEKLFNEYLESNIGIDDTLYLDNNYVIMKSNNVISIGKIKNDKVRGRWFLYRKQKDESFELWRIRKYTKKDTTVIYTRGIVNWMYW